MSRSGRRPVLLVDVPLGLLVGLACLVADRFAAWTARNPGFADQEGPGRGWPGWSGPGHRTGPYGADQTPVGDLWTAPGWPMVGCLAVLIAAVALRRLRPRAAFVAAVAAGSGYLLLGGPLGPVMLAPALTLLAMARSLPPRRWIGWAALLVPFVWSKFATEPAFGFTDPGLYQAWLFGVGMMLLPALVGLVTRNRRDAWQRTRQLELRRSASEERLRIAREVHDVVGHSLSVITMQAGVALYLLERRPEQAEASLRAIRSTSKNALDELRSTLAVFRAEDDAAGPTGGSAGPEARQPVAGLARIDDLVEAFRAGGRRVEVVGADRIGPLPAAVDLAGYRIVQESLTNVARHTDDAAARVRLVRQGDRLVVEIADDGPAVAPPAEHDGTGIAGMAERARALGGTLTAAPGPGGGFVVRAVLPVSADPDDVIDAGTGTRPEPGPGTAAGAPEPDRVSR